MMVLIELAGAVALLLWGIRMVQTGFARLLGNRLERLLRRTTSNRSKAFITGAMTAFMLQSSTAVILMVAAFSATGMLTLFAALATVLGAEFGASVAAVLLNMDLEKLSLPVILLGVISFKLDYSRAWKHSGRILIGLGLVLLSLDLIGDVTYLLRSSDVFLLISNKVESDVALAITLMGLFTWMIHSTLAAVLIIAQFVQDGTITMNAGFYLLLGANLGGALPALVSGWSLSDSGRQVVVGNLIFRFFAVALGLIALLLGGDLIQQLLPERALGIVIAHSSLNLANGLLLLAILPLLLPLFMQARNTSADNDLSQQQDRPIYLSIEDIGNPGRALANARNEALHIAELVYRMLNNALDAFDDRELVKQIADLDDDIDALHREALNYVLSIEDTGQQQQHRELISFMTNLEHIGDIIDESLMHLARNKLREGVRFDDDQTKVVNQLHDELVDAFRLSQAVFTSDSAELAQELLDVKRKYRQNVLEARQHHLDELGGHHSENLLSTQIFIDVLRDLQRICSHLTAVAYPVLQRRHN
ncbi:Na/Pi cotransporter family protein [Saccharospirillum mangrovi]|uniref:Na/Pi cotransporter family protein n=1 Tax=Saccharospirillum mangrovi TaxID=2161747 RepID=UPI000D333F33|nr:Na/Pi symporter [Saccharospirillum mangrovi]